MNVLTTVTWAHARSAAGVFLLWTLTSFLCHECSKKFLMDSPTVFLSTNSSHAHGELLYYRLFLAVVVTAVQCCSCLLLIRMDKNMCQSKPVTILLASHALATLATNTSMVFIEAAFTLAIKLMEPITMAIAHHVIFRKMVPIQTFISTPVTIWGALIFTAVEFNNGSDSAGIALAFFSNIILAARNITLKKMHHENTTYSLDLKPWPHIFFTICIQGLFVMVLYALDVQGLTVVKNSSAMVALALASGVFHVAYSYISTNIVLRVMNVISHSIANIFKRLLVVLLLSALGNRHLSSSNFLGLGIAVAGLLVYTLGKIGADQQSLGNVEEDPGRQDNKIKTYLTFLLLALISAIGVHSVGFPDRMSTSLASARYRFNNLVDSKLQGVPEDVPPIRKTESDPKLQEFLSWRLVDHPEETDTRSKTLTTNREIVEEAQRILMNLMQDLIGKTRHVMLIEIPNYENIGDPAIAAGEVLMLGKLNKTIVFHCETFSCSNSLNFEKAVNINKRFPKDELVILMQGGGNMIGYPFVDVIRRKYIDAFPDRKCVIFSQSIWLHGNYSKHLKFARETYSNRSNLVIFLRDRQSLEIAKKYFKGIKLILAPDLAFCIGMIPRQMPPLYDIIWLRRVDDEKLNYTFPKIPYNITANVGDWPKRQTNLGNQTVENAFLLAATGFQFLQRGRIVVTERLHGHILSMLLNIPHVIIDNPPYLKLSAFHKTWTHGLSNTILVSNGSQALDAALQLLNRYQNALPSVSYRHTFYV